MPENTTYNEEKCPHCEKKFQILNNHLPYCDKNPNNENYEEIRELKRFLGRKNVKEDIKYLFLEKGKSIQRIGWEIKKKYNVDLHQKRGEFYSLKSGLSNKILEILGFKDYDEYRKEYLKLSARARRKHGFTDKMKSELKEKYENKCAYCGKEEKLNVHHIDGNPLNNTESNLIVLCEKCHINETTKERNKIHFHCEICRKILKEISRGLIINGKDISEIEDMIALTCPEHPEESLTIFKKNFVNYTL